MTDLLMYAAADVARVAGDVALRHFRSALHVETKGDGSPVTIADRSAEAAARAWLAERFPDDGILGEEEGLTAGRSGRRWVVVAIANHPDAGAFRPVIDALVDWAAREP